MPDPLTALYHRALDELGADNDWYQTGDDLHYAAAVAAVDDVNPAQILRGRSALAGRIHPTDALHYVTLTVAAVSVARSIDIESLIDEADVLTEQLRPAARSKRGRRIAATVLAVTRSPGSGDRAGNTSQLHHEWNELHRLLTTTNDLSLAAITASATPDIARPMREAVLIMDELAKFGYRNEWDVARILAISPHDAPMRRFLALSDALRGRRRRPVSDQWKPIAFAALVELDSAQLVSSVTSRADEIREARRFQADASTAVSIAALMGLGASTADTHLLRNVFHGAALTEHYRNAVRRAK